jgi:hypothetical protein
MVHSPYAAIHFTAMMGTIWFPVQALLAEDRKANIVTHKYVLGIEVFNTRRRRDSTI